MPSVWLGTSPLLLASTSATRRLLLESAGLPVETEASEVDERAAEAECVGIGPRPLAEELARRKAIAVSRRRPGRIVVGADQVLALGSQILHTPGDLAAARRQIVQLAGRTHVLHSAAAVARDGAVVAACIAEARLTMRPLDSRAVAAYVAAAGNGATRSVGGYQAEGLGIHLFETIDGDHATILGLPLLPLLAAFRGLGLLAF